MTTSEVQLQHLRFVSDGWQQHAACKGLTDVFFSEGVGKAYQQVAYDICNFCPVTDECLEFACKNKIAFGIWGGQPLRQRRIIARQRGWVISHLERADRRMLSQYRALLKRNVPNPIQELASTFGLNRHTIRCRLDAAIAREERENNE